MRNEDLLSDQHALDSLGLRSAHGSIIAVSIHFVSIATQVAQLAVLSRLLSPDDFGVVAMAMAVMGFIRLFQDMGLMNVTVQRQAINQNFVSAIFFLNLGVAAGLTLVCWASAPLAGWFLNDDRLVPIIMVLGLTVPMLALRSQHRALLGRRMEFAKLNASQVAANLVGFLVAVGFALGIQASYWSVIASQLATTLADMLLCWFFMPWRPSWPRSGSGVRSAFSFGTSITIANCLGWVWKQSDNVLIGWRWGNVELGFYSRAYSILLMPISLVGGPVASALIPALSRLQDDKEKWVVLFNRMVRIVSALAGWIAAILIIDSEFFVTALLGGGWGSSDRLLAILSLSILPSITWETSRIAFLALGRGDVILRYTLVAAPLHLAAFALGLRFGAVGVAWGLTLLSWLLAPVILVVCARVTRVPLKHLLFDLMPVVIGFGAALVVAELTAPMLAGTTLLLRAACNAVLITVLFALLLCIAGKWSTNWHADISWLFRRLAKFAGVR